ncbi:unnamed protein product [Arctogadus glacialis]
MKHLSDSFPTPLNCFPTPMNRIHTPLNHIQPPSTNHCSPEASPTPLQHAPPCSPRGLCGRPRGDGTDRGKEEWWEDKLSAAFDAADPKEYSKLGCQPPRSEGVPLENGTEWEPYRRGGKQPKHLGLHVNWSTWPRAGKRRGERSVEGRESKAFGYDKTDSL